jgi:hypothetical protein
MAVVSSEDRRGPQPPDQQFSFWRLPKTVTVIVEFLSFPQYLSSIFYFSRFTLHSLSPVQHDSFLGTGGDTEVAAIAAAGVNEGRFIWVYLDDGLALANSAGQALATGVTQLVHHVGDGCQLSFGALYY